MLFKDVNLTDEEELLQRAILIALSAHKGQHYNIGNDKVEPYIFHVMRTASNVTNNELSQKENDILKTIAVLHDIVEDTFITPEYLKQLGFPDYIVSEVDLLTNKYFSYEEYITELEKSRRAILVKLADLQENIGNLSRLPQDKRIKKSLKYLPVRERLLAKLKEMSND